MIYFHVESGKNYRFSALSSGKKGSFLTKSQGKLFLETAGNPVFRGELLQCIGATYPFGIITSSSSQTLSNLMCWSNGLKSSYDKIIEYTLFYHMRNIY